MMWAVVFIFIMLCENKRLLCLVLILAFITQAYDFYLEYKFKDTTYKMYIESNDRLNKTLKEFKDDKQRYT